MKNEKLLIIGDTHTSGKREKAWDVACESIYKIIEGQKFDKTIILGDLFNSYPSILDRVMFSLFINKLLKVSKDILLIKGTSSHEFSQGIYNYEDILNLTNIKAFDELEINNFVFCHSEFNGLKYITGALSKSERIADKKKTYLAGHIHQPECSFNNVIYLGSVYKTSFSEINDQKRIAIITGEEIIE
jgi:predicted phosphodiesterase